ncbi:V-type ATPase [Meredithblackwellia eburnea MCA 4105]
MAAQNSQGIQHLLDAEKEASKIVSQARDYRAGKIKDARTEASKEIEALKAQMDSKFKEFEQTHSGDSTTSQSTLDKSTAEQLAALKTSFEQNSSTVIAQLLERVVQVKPVTHKNFVKA